MARVMEDTRDAIQIGFIGTKRSARWHISNEDVFRSRKE